MKWPELSPDNPAASGLNPSATRRTGGSGFDMGGEEDKSELGGERGGGGSEYGIDRSGSSSGLSSRGLLNSGGMGYEGVRNHADIGGEYSKFNEELLSIF